MRLALILAITLFGVVSAFRSPFYALLFYTWNAYFRPEEWAGWIDIIAQMRLSLTAALLVFLMTIVRRDLVGGPFPMDVHIGAMMVFVGHSLVSLLTSNHTEQSWRLWVEFLKQVSIVYMVVTLVNDQTRIRQFIIVVVYSLGLEGAKQGWVGLVLHPGSQNINESPFLGDNNGVAVGMLMLVPLLGVLAALARTQWERRLHQFVLIGVLYRSLTTYSRGGFLSCLALGFVYWLRSRNKLTTLLAMGFVVAIILPVLPQAFWDRMHTIGTVRQQDVVDPTRPGFEEGGSVGEDATGEGTAGPDASMLSRIHFWRTAIRMAVDHPILGIGFNSYNFAYDAYDLSKGFFGHSRSVHSMWFGLLGEVGFVGLGLYCLLVAMAFWRCRAAHRLARSLHDGGEVAAIALALQTAMVPMVVGGSFLPNQYNEMYWHFLGLSIAILRAARKVAEHEYSDEAEEMEEVEAGRRPLPSPVGGA